MLIFILKILSRFFTRLSPSQALAAGRRLGWFYGSVIRYHRKDALEALRRAFPEKKESERRSLLQSMYRNLGINLVEEFRLQHIPEELLKKSISWEGESIAHDVLAAGKGMIVLSAHLGNWDILCTLAPRFNYPTTIITKNIKNKALNRFWMEARSRFGLQFVPAHNSYRLCLAALRRNEIIGFILDQNMIRTEGIFVDFFGKPACTTPGLAFMSAQSGAPVVPVFITRQQDGTHRVRLLPAIAPPPDRKPETIQQYTQLYTKVIEDNVREHPDQWIWIHRRWRTQPL